MALKVDQQNLGSISQGMELNTSFREASNGR